MAQGLIHQRSKRPPDDEGFIYFVVSPDELAIKIGFAIEPETRIKGLQSAHYENLYIELILAGTRSDETLLHERFAQHKIKREWFRLTSEIEDFLADLHDAKFLVEMECDPAHDVTLAECLAVDDPEGTIDSIIGSNAA